jgi:hypothetical protein
MMPLRDAMIHSFFVASFVASLRVRSEGTAAKLVAEEQAKRQAETGA